MSAVALTALGGLPLQVDIDIGWLPDAIVRAFVAAWQTMMGQGISELLQLSVIPLLEVPNPTASAEAVTAWQSVFGLALTLLPLLIAAGVMVTPFSSEQDSSLWRQALRIVAVIVFIAISRPIIGFGVDATNAVTMALAPEAFKLSFGMNLEGLVGQFSGWLIGVIIYTLVFGAMLIAVLVTTLLLALRIYLVFFLFVSVPFLAVLWYADWGPLETVSEYGAMFLRVGVYALLAGPIVALLLRVAKVISTGGLITNATGSNPAAQFWASLILVLMIPILLIVGVWMSISFAGQPLGVGKVASLAIAGLAAMGGAAVGGATGSALGSKLGLGNGGGGRPSSGGTGSGGGEGTDVATDPAAGTGNSTVGSGISHDLDNIFADADQAVKEELAPHVNAPFGTEAKRQGQRLGNPLKKHVPSPVKSAGNWAKGKSRWVKETASGARGHLSNPLEETKQEFHDVATEAARHGSNVEFLRSGLEEGELDIEAAYERGLTDGVVPASIGKVPIEGGKLSFESATGSTGSLNVIQRLGVEQHDFQTSLVEAQTKGRRLRQLDKTVAWGKTGAKAPLKAGTTGARVTAGALTGHPYFAYRIGKGRKQRKLLLGPDTRQAGEHETQASTLGATRDTT